ncbi:cancer/testis antigen family 47 member C1 [Arvicanthis niloticus]|uniref:cancer/testis antigen 47A-like n=1 Tax=Arvicanthis niloticus TaxID=61156 RepID=UPI001486D7E9|nr:cancer/testis antigen 47A-like [Arvicanthis niloticus]
MSTRRDQDPARESRDNPVTLEGEWVQEAAEVGAVGLDGSSAAVEAEEIVVYYPRAVENVGPENNPEEEGDRGESVDVEEDLDIEAVDEADEEDEEQEEEEEEEEEEESVLTGQNFVANAHHFPMSGIRFMFMDLVHAILNRVYYNHHILLRDHLEDQEMNSPDTSESGHSSELQVLPGPIPSTVRAAEYEHQGSDLPEVISTFPELEEPTDFEEATDRYLQEPTTMTAGQAIEETAEEAAAEEAAEEPAKDIIEQAVDSEGENHCARQYEDDNIVNEEEEKEGKENEEALDEMDLDAADYCTNKFS